jgi:selenide,water dikinase
VAFDDDADPNIKTVVFDAQTSGGLLIAIEEERSEDLVKALEARSTPAAAIIGRFYEAEPGTIRAIGAAS